MASVAPTDGSTIEDVQVIIPALCRGGRCPHELTPIEFEERLQHLYPGVLTASLSANGGVFTPVSAVLPKCLNEKDKSPLLALSENGLQATYKSHVSVNNNKPEKNVPGSVRADHFIPRTTGLFYFEMEIIAKGANGYIGIGVGNAKVNLSKLPGWESDSYGYHADDGLIFRCKGNGEEYGPTFNTGDIIGCCVNFIQSQVFFTKNGLPMPDVLTDPSSFPSYNIWPIFGLRSNGECIEVNFGQKHFKFNFDEYLEKWRLNYTARLCNHSLQIPAIDGFSSKLSSADSADDAAVHHLQFKRVLERFVTNYLHNKGYADSSKQFNTYLSQHQRSASSFAEKNNEAEDDSMKTDEQEQANLFEANYAAQLKRKQIYELTLQGGRVHEVLSLCQEAYPTLFEQNRQVYFLLKCQYFIDLIASGGALATNTDPIPKAVSNNATIATNAKAAQANGDSNVNGESANANETAGSAQPPPKLGGQPLSASRLEKVVLVGRELHQLAAELAVSASISDDGTGTTTLLGSDDHRCVVDYVQQCFGLIAYKDPVGSSLERLLSVEQRTALAEVLNSAILDEHEGECRQTQLEACVSHQQACLTLAGRERLPLAMVIGANAWRNAIPPLCRHPQPVQQMPTSGTRSSGLTVTNVSSLGNSVGPLHQMRNFLHMLQQKQY